MRRALISLVLRADKVFEVAMRSSVDSYYGGKIIAGQFSTFATISARSGHHIPVWERYERTDGMFSRLDFTYDAGRDVYICPNGQFLRTTGTVHDGRARNYLSQSGECRVCELKERCTRGPFRKITRDINEKARDHVRALMGTQEFEQSSDERKKIEMRFAHLKTHHRFAGKPHLATTTG
jgi:hypothetical protein